MSLTDYLARTLDPPVYLSVPEGHAQGSDSLQIVAGDRHEALETAVARLAQCGRQLSEFRRIIAAVRNPYALEVSMFSYLQLGHDWDKGPAQKIAMSGDFERFAVEARHHICYHPTGGIERFFLLNGQVPPNLRILRHEHLEVDLHDVLWEAGVTAQGPLLIKNATEHEPFSTYLTPKAEEAIFQKYRWLFENGFYPRYTEEL